MAYTIQIHPQAQKEIIRIYKYIVDNWGFKAADKFYGKVEFKIEQIIRHPGIGRPSKKKPDFRKLLVAKRNIMYYYIEGTGIWIENLLNAYADPEKNPYE
jgi:plasmid stabilization system protein ParE